MCPKQPLTEKTDHRFILRGVSESEKMLTRKRSCRHAIMSWKMVLELKQGRRSDDVLENDDKNEKVVLELKKVASDDDGKGKNLRLLDHRGKLDTVLHAQENKKELLQFRGKRADEGWNKSGTSFNSIWADGNECFGSTTWNFCSGSEHLGFQIGLDTELENPQMEICGREQFGPGLKPSKENLPLLERERYCLYCYEKHSEMCVSEGRNPPSLNSSVVSFSCPLLWFTKCGHCGATAEAAHPENLCPMLTFGNLLLESISIIVVENPIMQCEKKLSMLAYFNSVQPYTGHLMRKCNSRASSRLPRILDRESLQPDDLPMPLEELDFND
ncbi:unnamed protein product [Angiostrongylus costaricensis]|uniref:Nanos-type domain-containing protein n=1 Tax=Angiostrongylus costaricensis TaxID=334426 RepID=A0A0R3PP92_ANGCS|nr:unnamed protein product [Angiostrongylus costaricensis]